MDLDAVGRIIGILVVLAAIAGSTITALVTVRSKASKDALRETNDDLNALIDAQRLKSEMQDVEIARLTAGEATCRDQVAMLTELVTQAAAVEKLGADLRGYHADIVERLAVLDGRQQ